MNDSMIRFANILNIENINIKMKIEIYVNSSHVYKKISGVAQIEFEVG